MKVFYILFLSLIISASFYAQNNFVSEKKMQLIQDTWLSRQMSGYNINNYPYLHPISNESSSPDTINTSLTDTMKYNMYGNLLDDDPIYNKKSPVWKPAVQIVIQEVLLNLVDHYVAHFDWSVVGFNSWNKTFVHSGLPWNDGWKWDNDRFGNNFLLHPYTGASYFNAARSGGYNYWESSVFTLGGSYLWKLFGENGGPGNKPERNDIIVTTLGGMVLGEGLYRLGSDVIDPRSVGIERVARETLAFIISPGRSFNRLLSGHLFDHTTYDVYQTEPLNLTFAAGYHRVNEGTVIQNGSNSLNLDLNLDYGNPFEKISRKPYDFYKVRADLDFGVGRKIVDNITGYGILYGNNIQSGNLEMLVGIFQHMDYFDNKTFELSTFAYGPGIISKIPIDNNSSIYTNLNVGITPFGALSRRFGVDDTTQGRDYDFVGGAEIKLESTYNIAGWVGLTFSGYYWWLHTYVGATANSYIGLIKPSITFNFSKNMSIGFEQLVYYSDRYPRDFLSIHSVRTEEKIFIQFYIEQFKFKK